MASSKAAPTGAETELLYSSFINKVFLFSLWATDHYQPLRIFAGHLADVTCTRFHPNSNYIATGSADRTIRLWDVLNGNCVRIFTGHKVKADHLQCESDFISVLRF